jgi:hypothetical protein
MQQSACSSRADVRHRAVRSGIFSQLKSEVEGSTSDAVFTTATAAIVLSKTELAVGKIKKIRRGRSIQFGSSLLARDFACG